MLETIKKIEAALGNVTCRKTIARLVSELKTEVVFQEELVNNRNRGAITPMADFDGNAEAKQHWLYYWASLKEWEEVTSASRPLPPE